MKVLVLLSVFLIPSFSLLTRQPLLRSSHRQSTFQVFSSQDPKTNSFFDFLSDPYGTSIPKELEKEIYAAEAKTEAARGRRKRVVLYTVLAMAGMGFGFFNVLLSEIRMSGITYDPSETPLSSAGFAWVESNFLIRFFLLNKIGGALNILGAGAAFLLAEAEMDTKRINAKKIFEEMQRRREAKESGTSTKTARKKKKKRSGKELKRMTALAELSSFEGVKEDKIEKVADVDEADTEVPEKDPEGLIGTLKNFYKRADDMAVSQALLLNKELEGRGIVDKITDESGLRVIGKQAAMKQQEYSDKTTDP